MMYTLTGTRPSRLVVLSYDISSLGASAAGVVPEYPNGQVYTVVTQPRTIGVRFSQEF